MKRVLSTFLCLCLFLPLYGQDSPDNTKSHERQVAVFVYCDNSVTTPVNALRAKLTSSLVNDGRGAYVVMDRTDDIMTTLKQEYNYQSGGLVRDDQIVSIGEHLGAYYVCVVNITFYAEFNQFFFECKLVNIETRQIEKQSFYPENDSTVSSLSPQVQVKVGEALSKAFYINETIPFKVGDIYYDEHQNPIYVEGCLMRIGYIDESGKHGFAYVELSGKYTYPYLAQSSIVSLRIPTIDQLKALYSGNRHLRGVYWALDSEPWDEDWRHYYFHQGSVYSDGYSSIRVLPNGRMIKRGKIEQSLNSFNCINIHLF